MIILLKVAGKGNNGKISVFYSGDIYVTSFALLLYEKLRTPCLRRVCQLNCEVEEQT